MTVTEQTPATDDVLTQQAPSSGPTERPESFTVEGLVAESNGQQNPMQTVEVTAPPTLDPQPSTAPPPPPPPTPAPEPEPVVDPEPDDDVTAYTPDPDSTDVQAVDISTALALLGESNIAEQDNLVTAEPWDHETIEFMGDTLHVRKPTDQALAGWSLASSRYVKMSTKNDISGLFIARHLSPATYDLVMGRLMDPDDVEYNAETIGKLMAAVVATRSDVDG